MEFTDSTDITVEEKNYYRNKLDSMLEKLRNDFGETIQDMKKGNQDFPDPGDRASFEFKRNTELKIRDRERKLIKKILKSIERLEGDEYNICEKCSRHIRKSRLDARPVTTLCIGCKEEEEQMERIQLR